VVERVT